MAPKLHFLRDEHPLLALDRTNAVNRAIEPTRDLLRAGCAMSVGANQQELDTIDHVAVCVPDVEQAIAWYTEMFDCRVSYRDESWALLEFGNVKLALVIPAQHPAHIAVSSAEAQRFGPLITHRDGVRSVYITDPWGNSVELVAREH